MFDPHTEQQQPRTRFDPAADRVINRTNDSYDSYGTMKFGSRVKKTVQKFESYRSWNGGTGGGGVHFGGETGGDSNSKNDDDDEFGVCSPPLWKTSPTRSPNHHQHHHHNNNNNNNNNNYKSLSSAQKSQAVAKGQRELMEMIRNMPESSYELSLRDLVEHPRIMEHPMIETRSDNIASSPEKNIGTGRTHDVVSYSRGKEEENWKKGNSNNNNRNKSEKKGQIKRNETFDNGGFLLKTAFPVSWGSSNKKKSSNSSVAAGTGTGTNNNACSKVSPRPSVDGSGKISVDKEWWKKKRLSDSRDSESAGLSSNSGSTGSSGSSSSIRSSSTRSNSRRDRSCTSGCWSILNTRKGKTQN